EELLSWILKGDFQNRPNLPENGFGLENQIVLGTATFFSTGARGGTLLASVDELRQTVYHYGSPRELLLSDLIAAVIRTRQANSTWATLPRFSEVQEGTWEPVLQRPTFILELWPAQRLLGERGLYRGLSA